MPEISSVPSGDLLTFRDCAELLQSGVTDNGVYTIRLPNSTQTVKVVTALSRLLTFSHKYHLTESDTKYIRHRNPSTSPGLRVVVLTHINASRWHLHSFFGGEEVSVNTIRANWCDVMLTCRGGGVLVQRKCHARSLRAKLISNWMFHLAGFGECRESLGGPSGDGLPLVLFRLWTTERIPLILNWTYTLVLWFAPSPLSFLRFFPLISCGQGSQVLSIVAMCFLPGRGQRTLPLTEAGAPLLSICAIQF